MMPNKIDKKNEKIIDTYRIWRS